MKPAAHSTPVLATTPTPRRRVRIPSGGGEPIASSAVNSRKVDMPKMSLERQLEILEKLEGKDYDQSVGPEQWLPPAPTFNLQQNLTKMNAVFGSVPMNIGQTNNINQNQTMHRKPKFGRVATLSDSELNLDENSSLQRRLFSSSRSAFSSPTNSTASYENDDEQLEGLDDGTNSAFAFFTTVDKRNKARWTFIKEGQKNRAIQSDFEFDDLVSKIRDINTSFERLKMNDRLGSIDINKLYPTLEKSTHFLPCSTEEQQDIVNCLYSTSNLCHLLSKAENGKLDFSENASKEKLFYLEKKVEDLSKWISVEEKETASVKKQLDFKTKLFSTEQINECSSNFTEGTLPSIIPTDESSSYNYDASNNSF